MSIPIDPSRAVGGRLATGDRIDVLFAGDHEVSIIVRDAEVIAIDAKGRGGIGETSSPFTVTIAVDAAAIAVARGRDRRRRHLACPHNGSAVVAGDRASGTRPGRRSCRRGAVGARMEPTIALVFSPELWVERLHRHLTDHGGARVRQIVLEPALALEDEYDTLVVSHRWPGLTRSFVDAVHHRSRCVLGVFDPDEAAGRDHLAALGVDGTIRSDAVVSEFVEGAHRAHAGSACRPASLRDRDA